MTFSEFRNSMNHDNNQEKYSKDIWDILYSLM